MINIYGLPGTQRSPSYSMSAQRIAVQLIFVTYLLIYNNDFIQPTLSQSLFAAK